MRKKRNKKKKKSNRKNRSPISKPLLSLCMIVKNEETCIGRCLESVQSIVDEIIIVDTGSTDNTIKICEEFGAGLYHYEWQDDFAAARNESLKHATGGWILVLDADEVIAKQDLPRLRRAILKPWANAYQMTTRNYTIKSNKFGVQTSTGEYKEEMNYPFWLPSTKIRLFRSHPNINFCGDVHELVEESISHLPYKLGDLGVPVFHYGDVEKNRDGSRHLLAAEKKVIKHPDDSAGWYELSRILTDEGRYQEALEKVEIALQLAQKSKNKRNAQLDFFYGTKGVILQRMKRFDDAISAYNKALYINSDSHEFLNNIGRCYEYKGKLKTALEFYKHANTIAPEMPIPKNNIERIQRKLLPKPSLSLCMIVKNEEKCIGRCLESVQSIVSEIIIVDTGSTDKTVKICEGFGAKVYHYEWQDDFAAARNESLKHALGDWILVLDADEVIAAKDMLRLQEAMRERDVAAFSLTTRNYNKTAYTAGMQKSMREYEEELGYPYWHPSTKIRLFKKTPDIVFEGPVHELVEGSIKKMDLNIKYLGVPVHHYGNVEKRRDGSRYLSVIRKKIKEKPDDPKAYMDYGALLVEMKNYHEALEYFNKAIRIANEEKQDSFRKLDHCYLGKGTALQELKKYDEAISAYKKAFEITPDDYGPVNNIGVCYEKKGDFNKAMKYYRQAHKISPDLPLPVENIRNLHRLMAKKGNISICMIVKNEEKDLPECLKLIKNLADEIIIVDTGSTDRTVAIAQEYGVKVFHFPWIDDFSAARNESLKHATGNWIIWLDADDRLYPSEHEKIRRLAQHPSDRAFYFMLQNEGIDHVKCYQLRMFPNRQDIRFERPVHEQVAPVIIQLGMPLINTDVVFIHTGYSDNDVLRAKNIRYINSMKQWLKKQPGDLPIRYHLAKALHTTDQYDEAVKEYRVLLKQFPVDKKQDPLYYYSWILLGQSYIKLNRFSEALSSFDQASSINPGSPLLLVSQAEAYINTKDYENALSCLKRTSSEPEKSISTLPIDYSVLKYARFVYSSKALLGLNQMEDAYREIQRAIDFLPEKPEGYKYLAEWHRKSGNQKSAIQNYLQAKERDKENFYYDFKAGEIYLQMKELVNARRSFLKAGEKNAAEPAIWMNLGIIERGCGNYDLALQYFRLIEEKFENYKDIHFQIALTYFDIENYAAAENALINEENSETKKWFTHLLLLYDDRSLFEAKSLNDFPELKNADKEFALNYFINLADNCEQNKKYYDAEFILRLILTKYHHNSIDIFWRLAHIQMEKFRIFQAITTLEQITYFNVNSNELQKSLQLIGQCYQIIGIEQAYEMCRQKLTQLELENCVN